MTAFESSDSNAFKGDDICLKIWEPNLIVLPVPENRENANTFLQINLSTTNNTPTLFPFIDGILTPKILSPDSQVLHPLKFIDSQITPSRANGIVIPPKKTLSSYLVANLFWKNDLLELQCAICSYFQISTRPDPTCFFKDLHRGTYQLRFTYDSPSGEFMVLDLQTGENLRVEYSRVDSWATTFVNVRFVEPVGTDNSAVEVDGIRFETVVPEQGCNISLRQSDVSSTMQIGMRITNNTSISQRFCSFTTLIPALMGADGLILGQQLGGGSLGWIGPGESDFHLLMSGESVTFFLRAHIERRTDGLLNLIVNGTGGGYWSLDGLKLGAYQVQLAYRSLTNKLDMRLFEDFWRGRVHTPFVEFCLVQP
jgi:hypothetical protein